MTQNDQYFGLAKVFELENADSRTSHLSHWETPCSDEHANS